MNGKLIPRRQAIPVLYTRGTNYDVGFDMGRTFSGIIKNYLLVSKFLNEISLPLYNTETGRKVYNKTLKFVKLSFPQYIRELEGYAEGAQVDFHKLFLLNIGELIMEGSSEEDIEVEVNEPKMGCTTIIANGKEQRLLGHTEDVLPEVLNHYFFVVAHVINDTPQGKYQVKEERFMSLCYAGFLAGFTICYNEHGLVYTVNTLGADCQPGKNPRCFIMRALLGAQTYDEAVAILKDIGAGTADGCSINMTFLNDESGKCYNIEMAPHEEEGNNLESFLDIKEIPIGGYNFHTNTYQRIKITESNKLMTASSMQRAGTHATFKQPETVEEIVAILGDCSASHHCIFRENGNLEEELKTICVGIFDLNARTLTMYSDNPRYNEPQFVLPLFLKNSNFVTANRAVQNHSFHSAVKINTLDIIHFDEKSKLFNPVCLSVEIKIACEIKILLLLIRKDSL